MATVNEQLRDESIAHAIWIARYSTGVASRMVKLLNESDAELTARLLVAMDGIEPNSFTVTRLEALLASVRDINRTAINGMFSSLSTELNDLAQHEAGYQLSLFDALLPEFVTDVHPLVGISPDAVYAAAMAQPFQGRLLSEWASNLEADRLNRINNTVRQGFLLGDTTEQIARNVRGHANRGYQDGALQMSRANAASIAKTAVGHLAATARNSFASANDDLMKGKQWLSTLDNRTTHICSIRDRLKYTLDNKPIGHKIPYLQGPGKIHFCAVVEGTKITTDKGAKPVEDIRLGDMVLTHKGSYEPVTQKMRKLNKNGRIVAINVDSGRVIRVTHDHPVLTSAGWKFAGALKTGDALFSNFEKIPEITSIDSVITTYSEDYPSRLSQTLISVLRTAELVPSVVDLDCNTKGWYSEIEKVVTKSVLANPSVIMSESELHHLFSLAHLLSENGLQSFGNFLSGYIRDVSSGHSLPGGFISTKRSIAFNYSPDDIAILRGIAGSHALREFGKRAVGFFSEPEEVMILSLPSMVGTELITLSDLFSLGADFDPMLFGEIREATIGETEFPFDSAEGFTKAPMVGFDDIGIVDKFPHETVNSISVVGYVGEVYDLGVGDSNSYFADGVLVSNCRSTETFILKSAKELGIDVRDIPPAERASMDGVVPGDTNYQEWFSRQSFERQKQIVGEKRARLIRDGGMSPDEFYTDKGEWLTLAQLRERDAQAFKDAGL